MSLYYKYNFISPEGIFAVIKEELKTYFDTGAIDDLLFPVYVNKCLSKLGKTALTITEVPLVIENYSARLPDNYAGVKEAWATGEIQLDSYRDPSSVYLQESMLDVLRVSADLPLCSPPQPECDCEGGDPCRPDHMQAIYKVTVERPRSYRKTYLLRPGNISATKECGAGYTGELNTFGQEYTMQNYSNFVPYSSTIDSFDIRGNKFVTNFRSGIVHLVMYTTDYDNVGNQMIPDNFRISEYIEAFLKYKVFEVLTNQTNDETFNQLNQKMQMYKQMADEAYIMADIETKKQTVWTKQARIKQTMNRHQRFQLSSGRRTN